MLRAKIYTFIGLLSIFSSLRSEAPSEGKMRPAWTSTLQCLAPLAREAREGLSPLTADQIFFDGPFHRQDPQPPSEHLEEGFKALLTFDDRTAESHFRELLTTDQFVLDALIGMALANGDAPRRAVYFLEQAKTLPLSARHEKWLLLMRYALIDAETQEERMNVVDEVIRLARSENSFSIAASGTRFLLLANFVPGVVLSEDDEVRIASIIESFSELAPLLSSFSVEPHLEQSPYAQPPSPVAWQSRANQDVQSGRIEEASKKFRVSMETELARLANKGSPMPEASIAFGETAERFARLLIENGGESEAEEFAREIMLLPRDLKSVGKRWRRLQRDNTSWVVGRRTLAEIFIRQGRLNELEQLPKGFSHRDNGEWYLWQALVALETGKPIDLPLALLRRLPGCEDLVSRLEQALSEDGPASSALAGLPGIPDAHEEEESSRSLADMQYPSLSLLSLPSSDFSLPDWQENEITLSSYAGKPVIVIFFLGGGCLHCVEQLTAFGPWAQRFRDQGIELLAVSTDPVAVLSETLALEQQPTKSFPIPIVSDHSQSAFRSWRVMDEFDRRAIHGTFLISPGGTILWSEIGNSPYMHPDYLLYESTRLLYGEERAVLP